jgi:hypothetical protein
MYRVNHKSHTTQAHEEITNYLLALEKIMSYRFSPEVKRILNFGWALSSNSTIEREQ